MLMMAYTHIPAACQQMMTSFAYCRGCTGARCPHTFGLIHPCGRQDSKATLSTHIPSGSVPVMLLYPRNKFLRLPAAILLVLHSEDHTAVSGLMFADPKDVLTGHVLSGFLPLEHMLLIRSCWSLQEVA